MDLAEGRTPKPRRRYGARVLIAMEPELRERLRDLSREKGISLSGLLRMAVHEWMEFRSREEER